MFRRKKRLSRLQQMRNFVWPELGWRRYGRYLTTKLSRMGGSTREIAAGVACGVAISFTPFVGFHFVLAAASAWLMRANIMASALGTAAGNPWTFPFIWFSVLFCGRFMLGENVGEKVEFSRVFEGLMHSFITFDFSFFSRDVWPVVRPMMVGCIPFYVVVWILTYGLTKRGLDKFNDLRNERRKARKV